jgi:hypothetical protein
MRFDTPIYFQFVNVGEIDPATGDYSKTVEESEPILADVTDAGTDTINLIYGAFKQGVKTIRLQNRCEKTFDRIRIGEAVYRVDFERKLRHKHTFVASAVK